MKKLLFLLLFLPLIGLAQSPMSLDNTNNIKLQGVSPIRSYNMFQEVIDRLDVQTATGTNTYVISGTVGITSYSNLSMRVLFTNGNTASSTLNVNSLGVKTLKNKATGVNLVSGDLFAGGTYTVSYDGTNLQVDLGGGGTLPYWPLGGSASLTSNVNIDGAFTFGLGQTTPLSSFNFKVGNGTNGFQLSSTPILAAFTSTSLANQYELRINADVTTPTVNQISLTGGTNKVSVGPGSGGVFIQAGGAQRLFINEAGLWAASMVGFNGSLLGDYNIDGARNVGFGQTNQLTSFKVNAITSGIGVVSPTAILHLKAGSATAGTASLKLDASTLLGTTEAGAIENNGTHLYYTAANSGTRFQLDQQASGTVSTVSVVPANGLAGTVANPTTTPAITLSTTITGLLKGNATAISAAVGSISGDYLPPASVDPTSQVHPELGQIINDNFNRGTIGANWVAVGGATYSIVANQLQITGGANTTNDYLRYDAYGVSNLTAWTVDFDMVTPTLGATSYGTGLTIKSVNGVYDVFIRFASETANSGKIILTTASNVDSKPSLGPLTLTAGDLTHARVTYAHDRIIVTWLNNTTGRATTLDYQFQMDLNSITGGQPPASYKFGISGFSAVNQVVDNFIVTGNDPKSADILFVGNSITRGFCANESDNTYPQMVSSRTGLTVAVNAGAGDIIADINASELIALAPKKIILDIGSNEVVANGVALTMSHLATLVSSLTGAGYVVGTTLYFNLFLPRGNALFETCNASLISTYPGATIDVYTEANSSNNFNTNYSFDGIHPNPAYHTIMAETIIQTLSLKQKAKKETYTMPLKFGQNNYVLVAEPKFQGLQAKAMLNIVNSDRMQFHLDTGPTGVGMYMTGLQYYWIMNVGASWGLSNYKATDTQAHGIQAYQGQYYFWYNTGLTAGNTFSPSIKNSITPTGIYAGGYNAAPTAKVHIAAGSTTANTAPLQFTAGPVETTPRAGLMEYDGTNLFFTPVSTRGKIGFTDLAQTITAINTFSTAPVVPTGAPLAGGTNASSQAYADAAVAAASLGPFSTVAPGYVNLSGNANALPKGDNTWIAPGTNGQIFNMIGGVPTWSSDIRDVNGNSLLKFNPQTSAVNQITVQNGIAGGGVGFLATGTSADIGLGVVTKGAGTFSVSSSTSALTNPSFSQISTFSIIHTSIDGLAAEIQFQKTRGTVGAPATVVNGDNIGLLSFYTYEGTGYVTAQIKAIINGTVSAGVAPTDLVFYTTTTNSLAEAFRVESSGAVSMVAKQAATSATTGTMTTTLTNLSSITITPTGACTFNATGGVSGQKCSFVITTSGTSAFVLTWGTNYKTTGTLSTGTVTAQTFTVNFVYNGTNWCETSRTTAM